MYIASKFISYTTMWSLNFKLRNLDFGNVLTAKIKLFRATIVNTCMTALNLYTQVWVAW